MVDHRDAIAAMLRLGEKEVACLSASDLGLPLLLGELLVFHEGADLSEVVRRPLADGRSALDVLLGQGGYMAQWATRYDGFARSGPFDAFSLTGRIDTRRLSHELGIPLSVLANAFGTTTEWLVENPEGQSVQWKAMELLGALNQLATHTTEKRYALWWLSTPQPEYGGRTPIEIMNKGHLDLVVGHISSIYFMVPD